jgi:hypothetical protein
MKTTDLEFNICSHCAQIATAIMASTLASSRGPQVNWNEAETSAFLDYLIGYKSEIGDGGMFKNMQCHCQHNHRTLYFESSEDRQHVQNEMANSTYFICLYPLYLTDCGLIFSSKQSTIVFRGTKTAHQIYTGITPMVPILRQTQRQWCGMDLHQSRYVIVLFYIIRNIKVSVSMVRQMLLYSPFTRLVTIPPVRGQAADRRTGRSEFKFGGRALS